MNAARRVGMAALLVVLGGVVVATGNTVAIALESPTPSRSVGTVAAGELLHGKRLPTSGPNFVTYSRLGSLLGRTCVHSRVRAAVLDAYRELARDRPELHFVYGETGWCSGGRFRPHRTHRNGLSVDFMVPVRDRTGQPADLPTWPWRKFGYGVEFDSAGRGRDLTVDFDALAAHLSALHDAAARHGLTIERVILAPEFEARLHGTATAAVSGLPFMRGRPWVRHNEHYHVDFGVLAP